jgi:hypothetical protein
VTWTAHSTDGSEHDVNVLLDAGAELATSYSGQAVVFARHRTAATEVLIVGTRDQAVLNRSGDDFRIDWGYFHIAVPNSESSETTISKRPWGLSNETESWMLRTRWKNPFLPMDPLLNLLFRWDSAV